jgi:hypothetical protein
MITRNGYSILKVTSHIKLAIISPKSSSPQIIGLMPKEINVFIFLKTLKVKRCLQILYEIMAYSEYILDIFKLYYHNEF